MADGQEQHQNTAPTTSTGMDPKIAGLLCYLFGWISGLIFYLIEKDDKTIRFHAMQSILLNIAIFVLWIGISIVLGIFGLIPGVNIVIAILALPVYFVLWIGTIVVWILLMVRAYQGEMWKLPIIGDIAERNA